MNERHDRVAGQLTIMLGSTYDDLQDYRSTLRNALERARFRLVVMESRGARPRKTSTEVRRWVRESDVYVAILGMRYGSRDPESGKSFTHLEFQEAIRSGKRCLVYLMDEEYAIPASRVDRGADSVALAEFKKEAAAALTPEKFTSPDNLASTVLADLIWLLHEEHVLPERRLDLPAPSSENTTVTGPTLSLPLDRLSREPYRVDIQTLSDDQKADIAAGLLVGAFRRGDFRILENQVSITEPVWNRLTAFMIGSGINHDKLATEILLATDVFYVRLLVMIAGALGAVGCVEAIVVRWMFDGREIDEVLRSHRYAMRTFKDVVREALSGMSIDALPILEKHGARARGRWHVYRVISFAIKAIKKSAG